MPPRQPAKLGKLTRHQPSTRVTHQRQYVSHVHRPSSVGKLSRSDPPTLRSVTTGRAVYRPIQPQFLGDLRPRPSAVQVASSETPKPPPTSRFLPTSTPWLSADQVRVQAEMDRGNTFLRSNMGYIVAQTDNMGYSVAQTVEQVDVMLQAEADNLGVECVPLANNGNTCDMKCSYELGFLNLVAHIRHVPALCELGNFSHRTCSPDQPTRLTRDASYPSLLTVACCLHLQQLVI